ncbi:MAG: DNA photolyase [Desulfobacterales bacterium]
MTIKNVFIDRNIAHNEETEAVTSRIDVPVEMACIEDVYTYIRSADDPILRGKEVLYISENRGRFLRPCPGTRNYNCCGYWILHIGTYCLMDCAYCILQSYFHPPVLQYFINHDKMTAELDEMFTRNRIHRIGTGEFTDSLIWEHWTNLSSVLVPVFARHDNAILELKTKTTEINRLKPLHHNRKTIMAWSLNSEAVIQNEENATACLTDRLEAAKLCESWGYPLAFHFDPIIIYENCEQDYYDVIERLFSCISPENIVWISLGTFRFMADLKSIIRKRFPNSKITCGEFIPGLDQKMRYFKPIRISLYRKIITWIRQAAPDVLVYFCMEDDEVWRKTLGFTPGEKGGLARMLDESAAAHCELSIQT